MVCVCGEGGACVCVCLTHDVDGGDEEDLDRQHVAPAAHGHKVVAQVEHVHAELDEGLEEEGGEDAAQRGPEAPPEPADAVSADQPAACVCIPRAHDG